MSTDTYTISKFNIRDVDIKEYIGSIELYEDITTPYISCDVNILDPRGLIESLPITGDEEVDIVIDISDANQISISSIKLNMIIHTVSDVKDNSDRVKSYNIKCVSKSWFTNKTKFCRKAYKGKASDIVTSIIDNMFDDTVGMNRVDPSKHDSEKYIFPNWHPFRCIRYITGHSVSAETNDPNYYFFMDKNNKFNLASMSYLINQTPYYGTFERNMRNNYLNDSSFIIHSIDRLSNFDLLQSYNTGLVGSNTIGHDIINKSCTDNTSVYTDEWSSFSNTGSNQLYGNHGSDHSVSSIVPISAPEHDGSYGHEIEDRDRLIIRSAMIDPLVFVVTITGTPNIDIGDVIKFDISSIVGLNGDNIDKNYSGKWLIKRIRHLFTGERYLMALEVMKDSLK